MSNPVRLNHSTNSNASIGVKNDSVSKVNQNAPPLPPKGYMPLKQINIPRQITGGFVTPNQSNAIINRPLFNINS